MCLCLCTCSGEGDASLCDFVCMYMCDSVCVVLCTCVCVCVCETECACMCVFACACEYMCVSLSIYVSAMYVFCPVSANCGRLSTPSPVTVAGESTKMT